MMAVVLDQVVRVGDVAVAAVVRRAVHAIPFGGLAVCGGKDPVAILVRESGATSAFDVGGARLPLDTFDHRFPGQRAEFEREVFGADRMT